MKQFLLIVREMYKALPDSMELLFENPPVFPQGTIPDPERIGQVESEKIEKKIEKASLEII